MTLHAINPATGMLLREYPEHSAAEAGEAIRKAHHAFLVWRGSTFPERAEALRRLAAGLRDGKARLARLMTEEMGKVLREAEAEVEKCAWVAEYYAEHAARFLADEEIKTEAARSFVTFQPLGVVLIVMPWNFPLWQAMRCAVPAIAAGNACALKHASNVPGCALAMEDLFAQSGFPPHLFRTLLVTSKGVEGLIAHPLVRAVSLTGGVEAGRAVARKAGEMIKKTVLELGGNDAYLVLGDADLDKAAAALTQSRMLNAGQSCIAAKRIVVVDSVHDRFVQTLVERFRAVTWGDPMDVKTGIGPLATRAQRDQLHLQVSATITKGAQCLLGGKVPEGPGAFYPPTVLAGVDRGMPAYDEELFGPVASIVRVRGEQEALEVVSGSSLGLGGGIFTRDIAHGTALARDAYDSGSCFINSCTRSDPRLPFGGVRESGYGRELSAYGIREFVNIKSISVNN